MHVVKYLARDGSLRVGLAKAPGKALDRVLTRTETEALVAALMRALASSDRQVAADAEPIEKRDDPWL